MEKIATLPRALESLRKVLHEGIRDKEIRAILDRFLVIMAEAENPERAKRKIVAWIRQRLAELESV